MHDWAVIERCSINTCNTSYSCLDVFIFYWFFRLGCRSRCTADYNIEFNRTHWAFCWYTLAVYLLQHHEHAVWLTAIVRQTYRKYLAGQSMSAFRPSLLPLTSRPSPLNFRPRLSPSQFAPRSFPLADRPSLVAPRSFSLAPQCPSRNSIRPHSHQWLQGVSISSQWTVHWKKCKHCIYQVMWE